VTDDEAVCSRPTLATSRSAGEIEAEFVGGASATPSAVSCRGIWGPTLDQPAILAVRDGSRRPPAGGALKDRDSPPRARSSRHAATRTG